MKFYCKITVSSCTGCASTHGFLSIGFHDNNKFKQGHFEMGIHFVNFMPISNRCARKRAALCPLTKCYQEGIKLIFSANENHNIAVVGYYGK